MHPPTVRPHFSFLVELLLAPVRGKAMVESISSTEGDAFENMLNYGTGIFWVLRGVQREGNVPQGERQ